MKTAVVILAAGQGTRMNSDLPKVLHPVAGAALLQHAMASAAPLEPERTVIVAGHGADQVRTCAQDHTPEAKIVLQQEQLGTAHAVLQARTELQDFDGNLLVLYGDTPFIGPETLAKMTAARATADLVVLGFNAADPGRYGRLITQGDSLKRIVEFKDASAEERAIKLCNSGVMLAKASGLFALLDQVSNDNAAGEYYLTDCVALAQQSGQSAQVVICNEAETLGVNSRIDLAAAEATFQDRARNDLLENGVTMAAPESVYLSYDTVIGRDATIEQNVVFGPGVTIESGALIRAFSHLEGCHVAEGAVVGPYARLRPGTELAEAAKVGNFVEIKNAEVGEGAKINHLSYVGDATVGAKANLGAGTITCNYDGVMKHRTDIGAGAFIGSNTMLVAPVRIGAQAMTGSGSVITEDVAEGDLALARAKQVNKTGLAIKLFDLFKKRKAKSDLENK
ncbi:MAG: bifunctional UDP-N-acetylglucosamine diphosphorylase/glucosamine-1-phosphate N-acetyltransferase GlmU [Paracoccaceae bacterium]|nr:bifunctional UDP-N-acetylglucosamine diphosphorylase/glucosamine-1-phosphate N-acetyltransferase GlmU [Paracoccaceae bacterium]